MEKSLIHQAAFCIFLFMTVTVATFAVVIPLMIFCDWSNGWALLINLTFADFYLIYAMFTASYATDKMMGNIHHTPHRCFSRTQSCIATALIVVYILCILTVIIR